MKRLLKKANEKFIYKFNSPIIVNIGDEQTWQAYTTSLSESEEYANVIKEAIDSEMSEMGSTGLASYITGTLKESIDSIIVTVENYMALTIVTSNKELSDSEKESLKEYISGQFSDGWGEGFEQTMLDEWTEISEDEEFDEETQEYYLEESEYKVTMSASLWDNKNWDLKQI